MVPLSLFHCSVGVVLRISLETKVDTLLGAACDLPRPTRLTKRTSLDAPVSTPRAPKLRRCVSHRVSDCLNLCLQRSAAQYHLLSLRTFHVKVVEGQAIRLNRLNHLCVGRSIHRSRWS